MNHDKQNLKQLGLAVIRIESQAISALESRIDEHFVQACELMLNCKGRIVVIGMGKSGHIGNKIAATLASTGSPAFFVHPGEASHGDLGMITQNDVVLALSYSGETNELLTIIPLIKRFNIPLVGMSGNPSSSLAKQSTVHLNVNVSEEACPLGLAPTSSTTASLVMGDALAVALLEARGFTKEDFALSHPGGSLGKKLLLKIDDLLHVGDAIPSISEQATVSEALVEMTAKKMGMTAVTDTKAQLVGIFTDGDLRRMLESKHDLHNTRVAEVMSRNCTTLSPGTLAAEALQKMEAKKINALLVTDSNDQLVGALNMHDLLRAGVV
jgi:arabinose-5-phosphate isomerase